MCKRICHKLAGSGSMYGFAGLTQLARQLGEALDTGAPANLDKLADLLANLHAEYFGMQSERPATTTRTAEQPESPAPVHLASNDVSLALAYETAMLAAQLAVRRFDNGQALVDALAVQLPRAFVLAWDLPGLDGPAVIDAIRAKPELRAAPILLVTSKPASHHALDILARGADLFIEEPMDAAMLVRSLSDLLGVPD